MCTVIPVLLQKGGLAKILSAEIVCDGKVDEVHPQGAWKGNTLSLWR